MKTKFSIPTPNPLSFSVTRDLLPIQCPLARSTASRDAAGLDMLPGSTMKKIALPEDVFQALTAFASEQELPVEDALVVVLRDWLVEHSYLEEFELDEETETVGSA